MTLRKSNSGLLKTAMTALYNATCADFGMCTPMPKLLRASKDELLEYCANKLPKVKKANCASVLSATELYLIGARRPMDCTNARQ